MRKLAVLCAGLLGLTLLVGCGAEESTGTGSGASDSGISAPAVAPPGLREEGAPAPQDSDSATTARKEVVTGDVALVADDPIAVAGVVADRVRELDGRVDSRTEQPETGDTGYRGMSGPSATLTVRLPSDRTEAFVDGLGQIGELTSVSLNRADVTMQWEDLDARIRALQTSVDRLRALIAGATTTADLIAAEEALTERQAELDSLTGQKRLLDDQIALSTLTVSITSEAPPRDADEPTSFWGGLVAGWNSLVDWLEDAVVFTGRALPWLAFLALLGGLIFAIVRAVGRRRPAPARRRISPLERTAAPGTPARTPAAPGAPAAAAGAAASGTPAAPGAPAASGTTAAPHAPGTPAHPGESPAKPGAPDADRPRDDHPEQP